jgi:uncharacterized protein YecE (DUF72 family)
MGPKPIPVWIGTAGYSWPDWVGPFYPPGTTPERMPGFYATQFPFVEINSTFYRVPTKGQLSRLAIRTPAGFRFSLKVPRTITHELKEADIDPFREAAEELSRRDRLIGLVLQFPETFTNTIANRDWLDWVSQGLKPHTVWVEFRHFSWRRLRLGAWLRDRGLNLVAVDVPSLPNLFPRGVIPSETSSLYVRLHSRTTDNWNGIGKVRYDYDYPDDVLREWIGKIKEASEQLTDVHLVFNNCQSIQGVRNARRMAELIEKYAPEFEVVGPAAPARPKQLTLFGE